MNLVKYFFMILIYLWLRFDLILRLAFGSRWTPRYNFMADIFGEKDAKKFLLDRGKKLKLRQKKQVSAIFTSDVDKKLNLFLKTKPTTKKGLKKRLQIINKLIFWTTDSQINRSNIDSYKTRQAIVNALLNHIFQNSLTTEADIILANLNKIVYSRVTYLGSKGEPSPIVHDAIISGVGRILTAHFNEIVRLRDEKTDKMIKIKMIKEIQKSKKDTGSLAFSADIDKKDNPFKNKYPLSDRQAKMLINILKHYRHSAWPDSRETAQKLVDDMEAQLGFEINTDFN